VMSFTKIYEEPIMKESFGLNMLVIVNCLNRYLRWR